MIKIKLHYSLLVFLIITLFAGIFINFLILFFSIIVHEMAHLLLIYIFKLKPKDITITAFGGVINVDLDRCGFFKKLLILISGVSVNFLILSYSYLFSNYQNIIYNYNLLLILFNILPIFPLDGHKILELILSFIPNHRLQFKITFMISIIGIIFLFFYSIIYKSLGFLIITIYLTYKNNNYYFLKDDIILKKIVNKYKIQYNKQ